MMTLGQLLHISDQNSSSIEVDQVVVTKLIEYGSDRLS